MTIAKHLLIPNWVSKPASVHAIVSTREGGISKAPFASLNLGAHVGDQIEDVSANRAILNTLIPKKPIWLNQVHGTQVSTPFNRQAYPDLPIEADAAVSNIPNEVLAILTADCLPVLFASANGKCVGAAHAGWRGLCNGVLEKTVAAMQTLDAQSLAQDISVWLGPAISPHAFEVGADVLEAFEKSGEVIPPQAFIPIKGRSGKYLANLYLLAQSRLNAIGITHIEGGDFCTFSDLVRFFSYRRDGQTGRFASCIWLGR